GRRGEGGAAPMDGYGRGGAWLRGAARRQDDGDHGHDESDETTTGEHDNLPDASPSLQALRLPPLEQAACHCGKLPVIDAREILDGPGNSYLISTACPGGRPRSRGRARTRAKNPLDAACDLGLGPNTHDAIDLPAAVEHQQGRDAGDVTARGRRTVRVDVELADPQPARHLDRDLLDHQYLHLAGPAPGRPRVEQHRRRRALDVGGERGVGHGPRAPVDDQGAPTAAAD